MVNNEFECELLRDGSPSTEEEVDPLQVANDWHLLFPEAVQNINTVGNSSNNRPRCHQEEDHQGHGRNSSVDAIDEASSSSSTSSSSTSSSSDTTSEDVILFGIGLGKNSTSDSGLTLESDNTHLAFTNERISFAKAKEPENSHTVLLGSNRICNPPLMITPSPMHNPPAQVMERDDGYDPHRIPSCVFARTDSVTPADWSIGSNESLFSLQVGNTSISREQSLYLSGELERLTRLSKEGELSPAELRELRKLAGMNKSREISMARPQPSTIPEVESEIESEVEEATNLEEQKEKKIEVIKEKLVLEKKIEERHQHRPISKRSSNLSRPSDVSEESNYSFAFPILGQTEKSAPLSGHSRQLQSGQPWEAAKASLVASEPVIVKKRRCFYCFSCRPCSCLSCPRCFSCSRCSSCYSCLSSLCFSCSCSCACCSWKACCPKCC